MNETLAKLLFALQHPVLIVKYWIWGPYYRKKWFREEWEKLQQQPDQGRIQVLPEVRHEQAKPLPGCEVCGGRPNQYAQDIREIAPTRGNGKDRWRAWERDGPPHFYCAVHGRFAVVKELSEQERNRLCPMV